MPRLTTHARDSLVQERKQQILTAAAQVFADKGFEGATISDIARAAGVAEGSIYNYFKNKHDLLVHIPRLLAQPALDAVSQVRAASHPPDELLTFIATNILTVILQNREIIRVLFASLPTMSPEVRDTYIEQVPLYATNLLQDYIAEQQAAGVFRRDLDPAIAARIFPGMMIFFLLIQEIMQPANLPRVDYEQVIPHIVTIFTRGMLNPLPRKQRKTRRSKKR